MNNDQNEYLSLKKAVRELKFLNEIAIATGRTTDIEKILNIIVAKTKTEIESEQCSIMILPDTETKSLKTLVRQDDDTKLKRRFDIYDQIIGLVVKNSNTIVIKSLKSDKRFIASIDEKRLIKNILCSPIWYKGKIFGVFLLTNKKTGDQFNPEDQRLMTIIATQTGQLIQNVQLQKEKLEKKELEAKLRISEMEKEKLKELEQIKKKFFEEISHEFRTPLTLIQGPVNELIKTKMDESHKEKLNLVKQNAERLIILTSQMIELSKLDSEIIKVDLKEVNLIDLIHKQILGFQPYAECKNISVSMKTELKKLYMLIDEEKIIKCITNLLSNAVKFSNPRGMIEIQINIVREEQNEFVIIKCIDDGIGIDILEQNKIFDRFYRSDLNKSKYEGYGIGLSLTKELIELHSGNIKVESVLGQGSTFTIKLPIKYKSLQKSILLEDKEKSGYRNEEKLTLNRKKMLLVDDNLDVRKYVKSLFEINFNITESSDGLSALDYVQKTIPDIIISDQKMPNCDGLELCSKIKSDEKTSHIPFILLTAKAEDEFKVKAYRSGVDDFLIKPFNPEELISRVFNLISIRNRLKKHYCNKFILEPSKITIVNKDEEFLLKAIGIVEKHIEEPEFTVEQFSEELFMSRIQLYRKIHALTGKSIREFITSIRIKRAKKLLENDFGCIADIAYKVGFNEAAYFSKKFHDQTGFTPTEYLSKHINVT